MVSLYVCLTWKTSSSSKARTRSDYLHGPALSTAAGTKMSELLPAAECPCHMPELPAGLFLPRQPLRQWAGLQLQPLRKAQAPSEAHNGPFDSTGLGSFRKNTFPTAAPVTKAGVPAALRQHRASVHQETRAGARGQQSQPGRAVWLLGRWKKGWQGREGLSSTELLTFRLCE